MIRLRLSESRDIVGFNLAALKMVAKIANDRRSSYIDYDGHANVKDGDLWAGLGLGSDVAAALEKRGR